MLEITLKNTTTLQEWKAQRETMQEINEWLDLQKVKPLRNIDDTWYLEELLDQVQINSAIDERFTETSDNVYVKEYLIPAQAEYYVLDITEALQKKEDRDSKRYKGRILKELSQNVLDIIGGYCIEESFTSEQIGTFRAQYATVLDYLNAGMPISAKPLIDEIIVDGVIIKQTLADSIDLEYAEHFEKYPEIFT